ncbi:MAG TPA: hypothetical protein VEG62_02110 [Acidimicrobiales bacterium]|nr:hypothetical protein [Acidimicrobiales bacterium]
MDRRALSLASVVASAAAVAVLWAPWVRTGRDSRSAFALVSALRGAGLIRRGPAEALFAVVAVSPGLAGAAWVLWVARFRRASAAAVAAVGALVAAAALTACAVDDRHATGSLEWVATVALATLGLGVLSFVAPYGKAPA